MTKAICVFCGEMKFGAFILCKSCSKRPLDEDKVMMSLALTDHYFSENNLLRIGRDIKAGQYPKVDEATRANLKNMLDEFKRTPAGRLMFGLPSGPKGSDKERWWKIW